MSTAGASGADSWRRPLAIVLAILGVLAVVAGILYVAGAANSLHFMVGKVHHGRHQIRAVVSLVIGVVLLVAAWFIAKGKTMTKRPAPEASRPAPESGPPVPEASRPAPEASRPAPETSGPATPSTNAAPTVDNTDGG